MRTFTARQQDSTTFVTFIEDGEGGKEVPYTTERAAKVAIFHFLQEYSGFLPAIWEDDEDEIDYGPSDEQLEKIVLSENEKA